MARGINAPDHGKNIVDGLNTKEKCYFNEQMELIDKLVSNNTSNIGMLPIASKDVPIKFEDQCIHILNNNKF